MRLGGPIFEPWSDPESWAQAVRTAGYRAALCPIGPDADDATVRAFAEAAERHDIVIAEVGAWSNPISPHAMTRHAAVEHSQRCLDLAERIGARCCANITGSRHPDVWDGPHPDNLSDDTFGLIVETIRKIVDAVKPTRTFYAIEAMQWTIPDSAESYQRLLGAVKRDRVAVHFDPVDLINSPRKFFNNAQLMKDFIKELGPHIKACHARDLVLTPEPLVHLQEVRPGLGGLDYPVFLKHIHRLDPNLPVILERLPGETTFVEAATYVREVCQKSGIAV